MGKVWSGWDRLKKSRKETKEICQARTLLFCIFLLLFQFFLPSNLCDLCGYIFGYTARAKQATLRMYVCVFCIFMLDTVRS